MIYERLYRMLMTHDWLARYPEVIIKHSEGIGFDHNMLHLRLNLVFLSLKADFYLKIVG